MSDSDAAAKIAVSVPADLLREVERARRKSGRSRSAIVQEALRQWLHQHAARDLVRDYEAGYRRAPEQPSEITEATAIASTLLQDDDAW
jgi:metal-responsive CopG/Arc/MetJ family transcriptional regulator